MNEGKKISIAFSTFLCVTAIYIFSMYSSLGDSYVQIHDNLVSWMSWSKLRNLTDIPFLSLSGWIPNALSGNLPVSTIARGIHVHEEIMALLPDLRGMILVEFFISATAFSGMYLLLRRYILISKDDLIKESISILVALIFSLYYFRPSLGVSIAGLPLLSYAFLRIHEQFSYKYLFPIFLYAFSIRSGSIIFIVEAILVSILTYFIIKKRKVDFRIAIIFVAFNLLTLAADYRLVYDHFINHTFITNRVNNDIVGSISLVKSILMQAIREIEKLGPVVACVILTGTLLAVIKRYRLPFFIGCWLLRLFLFSGLGDLRLVPGIQFNTNASWASIIISIILLAISMEAICNNISNKLAKQSLMAIAITYFIFFSISASYKAKYEMTINEFYSQELFDDISTHIGLDKSSYRVASLGIPPVIALYNGFYTVDGYFNIYPQSHRNKMIHVMRNEIKKMTEPVLIENFSGNLNHCQIFSSELGALIASHKHVPSIGVYIFDGIINILNYLHLGWVKDYIYTPVKMIFPNRVDTLFDMGIRKSRYNSVVAKSNKKISNLKIDIKELHELGAEFIFSGTEILNHNQIDLTFVRKFDRATSPWTIWLYQLTPVEEKTKSDN
jgi:hypothetical protein